MLTSNMSDGSCAATRLTWSWCESNDPNFTAKAADVVGLYVAPPAKAIVLCVDEKPSIHALEQRRLSEVAQWPRLDRPEPRLHGTTTLFAALEVATGKIIAVHTKRRRRVEFLDFMNSVTAAFPGRTLHVIPDNFNTQKKNEHWLKAHTTSNFISPRQVRPGSIRSRLSAAIAIFGGSRSRPRRSSCWRYRRRSRG